MNTFSFVRTYVGLDPNLHYEATRRDVRVAPTNLQLVLIVSTLIRLIGPTLQSRPIGEF